MLEDNMSDQNTLPFFLFRLKILPHTSGNVQKQRDKSVFPWDSKYFIIKLLIWNHKEFKIATYTFFTEMYSDLGSSFVSIDCDCPLLSPTETSHLFLYNVGTCATFGSVNSDTTGVVGLNRHSLALTLPWAYDNKDGHKHPHRIGFYLVPFATPRCNLAYVVNILFSAKTYSSVSHSVI